LPVQIDSGAGRELTSIAGRAIGCVALWFLPATPDFDTIRIFAISAAICFFFLYFGSLGIDGDAPNYLRWSEALAHGDNLVGNRALFWNWYDGGMPLVMLISGYPWTHSLIRLVILQALMGMTMPLLAYSAIRPWFPWAAYYTAIVSAVVLAPFLLFKWINHDQPYIFFTELSMWLVNRYLYRAHPAKIYAMTAAVFLAGIIKPLGLTLYPPLIGVCWLLGRDRSERTLTHFLAAISIFLISNYGYSNYRSWFLVRPLSVLGAQMFSNIYLNSRELGVTLAPDIGPNMKLLFDRTYESLLPSPAEVDLLHHWQFATPDLTKKLFYEYDARDVVEHMFLKPNMIYWVYIIARVDDRTLLMASLETMRAHPVYVATYMLRNMWEFIYDPGWLHEINDTNEQIHGGLLFPFSGATTVGRDTGGDTLIEPARSEANFRPLTRQPEWIKTIYYEMERAWAAYYQSLTRVGFLLILVTWFSACIGFLNSLWRMPALARWSEFWISEKVVRASLAASMILLASIAATGFLVDPLYRYDYSLLMFKVILAGIGVTVLFHVIGQFGAWVGIRRRDAVALSVPSVDAVAGPMSRRQVIASWGVLLVLVIGGLGQWPRTLSTAAAEIQPDGSVYVVGATLGENCGLPKDNALEFFRSACSGRQKCVYVVDWREVAFPTDACAPSLTIDWRCSASGPARRTELQGAADRTAVPLSCRRESDE
jgi:hypothetical protein